MVEDRPHRYRPTSVSLVFLRDVRRCVCVCANWAQQQSWIYTTVAFLPLEIPCLMFGPEGKVAVCSRFLYLHTHTHTQIGVGSSEQQAELCGEPKVLFLSPEELKCPNSGRTWKMSAVLPAVPRLPAVQFAQWNVGCSYLKWMIIMGCLLSRQIISPPSDADKRTCVSSLLHQSQSFIFT